RPSRSIRTAVIPPSVVFVSCTDVSGRESLRPMNRRDFMRTTGAVAGVAMWPAARAGAAAPQAPDQRLMKIALTPGSIGVTVSSQLELNALAHRHRYEAVEPRATELAGMSQGQIAEVLADLGERRLAWAAAGLSV